MAEEALAKKWNLAGQVRPSSGNNYPMVDLSNPEAKAYWQAGIQKLLDLGVAGLNSTGARKIYRRMGHLRYLTAARSAKTVMHTRRCM